MSGRWRSWGAVVLVVVAITPNVRAAEALMEEITITAQKREQPLQDVGIAVTAFTGEQIQQLGFTNSIDIVAHTPGMTFGTPTAARQQRQHRVEGRRAERLQRQQRIACRHLHRRGVRQRHRRRDVPVVRPRSGRSAAGSAGHVVRPERIRRSRAVRQRCARQGIRRLRQSHTGAERAGQIRTGGERADHRPRRSTPLGRAGQIRRLRPQPRSPASTIRTTQTTTPAVCRLRWDITDEVYFLGKVHGIPHRQPRRFVAAPVDAVRRRPERRRQHSVAGGRGKPESAGCHRAG